MTSSLSSLLQEAEKLIKESQRILIAGHVEPDADSLGACLALKMALKHLGKEAEISARTNSKSLSFLPGFSKIKNDATWKDQDLIIGVDYGNIKRLDIPNFDSENKLEFLTLDHHPLDKQKGFKIIRPEFSSTSELLFFFLKELGIPLSADMATCLLAGIFDDTGGFRHSTTSAETLEVVGELLKKGAALPKISKNLKKKNPVAEAKVMSLAMERIQNDPKSGLLAIFFSKEDLAELPDDFDKGSLFNFLTGSPEAKAVLILQEKNNEFEGSLRSEKEKGINVAELAKLFDGGGHPFAAGFRTKEAPQLVIEKLKTALEDLND